MKLGSSLCVNPFLRKGQQGVLQGVLFFLIVFGAAASDWPTYRHDDQRSGVTGEQVDDQLSLRWVFRAPHRPEAAWPLPGEETPRMHTDRAFHTVISGKTLYFGTSVDHKIYALDTESGSIRWTFFCDAAIRFAPVIHGDKLYFGSDDGHAYCLNAADGREIWKFRPGPFAEHIVGRSRMISLWPLRTGLIVNDGIVYFTAGIFPYEGLYIGALNAETGELIWMNDTAGDLAWGLEYGGMAPQGYLLASRDVLFVPSGRSMPATFDKKDGRFMRFLSTGGKTGGTWAMLDEDRLIAGVNNQGTPAKVAYDGATGAKKGNLFASFPGLDLLLTSDKAFSLTEEGIFALDREKNRFSEKELPIIGKQKDASSKEIISLRKEIKDLQAKGKDGNPSDFTATLSTLRERLTEQTALLAAAVKRELELKENRVDWKYDNLHLQSFILADQTLFASGNGIVVSVDSRTGKELALREIDGEVLGMSAADGKLFLSTDRGEIFAFGKSDGSPVLEVKGLSAVKPRGHSTTTPQIEEPPTADAGSLELAAERILNSTGIEKGFCLVLDGREGRLAFEIARRSELKVVVLESDVTLRDRARKWLDDQGIYGRQIQVVSWALEELPDYFANLIVSEGMLREGKPGSYSPEEIYRVLRPFGGEAVFGVLNKVKNVEGFSIEEWWKQSGATEKDTIADLSGQESWFKSWFQITRNELIGSGSWKGLYGNAANTASTDDQLVKGPLGVLWFGEPGSEHMLERHSRTVGPLAVNGRLFVQGMELVQAYDGYNGTFLWERKIPGAVRVRVDVDGGNIYADDQSLFVAAYEKVFRLDAATGETIAEYEVPPTTDGRARRWAYISVVDGILFGSTAEPLKNQYGFVWNTMIENGAWKPESEIVEELRAAYVKMVEANPKPDAKAYRYFKRGGIHWRYMNKYPGWGPDHNPGPTDQTMIVSDSVFAFQVDSGKLIWQYDAPQLPHISITIGDGNLYLIHGELSAEEKETAAKERLQWIRDGVYFPHAEADLPVDKKDFRRLTALDAETGETLWSQVMDVTGCGGNKLGSSYHDGKLLLFGHYSNHDQNVFVKGGLNWRRITVLAGSDGQCLWSKPLNYRRRPLVVGNRIYIEPRACSLDTGDIVMRDHPITGESVTWEFLRPGHSCGIVTAAPNGIFFRSYCAAIVNVEKDTGLQLFGAMRTGCWNNLLPANGVLNFQESSAGCSCSYALRSTVVLKYKKQKEPGEWSVFITQGAQTPVSHLAINLGAPGDMRDDEGTLWFGYPRPDTKIGQGEFKNYGLKFDIHETVLPGMGVFRRDFRGVNIEGSNRPWLYTSGLKGLKSCRIKLLDGQKPSAFKVRIGFVALKEDGDSERSFSLKLQGREVLKKFSVLRESGRHGKAVIKEFEGIQVIDDLHLEVIPDIANPSEKDAPMIHFIEIINQGDSNRTIAVN